MGISTTHRTIISDGAGTDVAVTADSRFKVDALLSGSSAPISYSSKLRYVDMNASSGGVARNTSLSSTWTDIFSYSGSGLLMGFLVNVETFSDWEIRLLIDEEEVFDTNGILFTDITADTSYDLDTDGDADTDLGLNKGSHDRLVWHGPLGNPVRYTSSITIKIRRTPTKASKKFQAGLVILTKES